MALKLVDNSIWDTDTMTIISTIGNVYTNEGWTLYTTTNSKFLGEIFEIYYRELSNKKDISFLKIDKYSYNIRDNYTKEVISRDLTLFKRDGYTYEIYNNNFILLYKIVYKKGSWNLNYHYDRGIHIGYLSDILIIDEILKELNSQKRSFWQRIKDIWNN